MRITTLWGGEKFIGFPLVTMGSQQGTFVRDWRQPRTVAITTSL